MLSRYKSALTASLVVFSMPRHMPYTFVAARTRQRAHDMTRRPLTTPNTMTPACNRATPGWGKPHTLSAPFPAGTAATRAHALPELPQPYCHYKPGCFSMHPASLLLKDGGAGQDEANPPCARLTQDKTHNLHARAAARQSAVHSPVRGHGSAPQAALYRQPRAAAQYVRPARLFLPYRPMRHIHDSPGTAAGGIPGGSPVVPFSLHASLMH